MKAKTVTLVCPKNGDIIPCDTCKGGSHVHTVAVLAPADIKYRPVCDLHKVRLEVEK